MSTAAQVTLFATCFAASCVRTSELELPAAGEDEQTLILLIESPHAPPAATRDDGAPAFIHALIAVALPVEVPIALSIPEDGHATALYYRESLDAMQLEKGALPIAGKGELGRRLPQYFARAYTATVSEGTTERFEARTGYHPPDILLALPAFDRLRCTAGGGCAAAQRAEVCLSPCPDIAAPREPGPPEPPRITEIPPWIECAPPAVQRYGDSSCTIFGADCPLGIWPADIPTNIPVKYVDAAALAAGDGTIGAPFPTIRAAVLAAAPGTFIAIAKGTYRESLRIFTPDLHLAGACPAETKLLPQLGGPSVFAGIAFTSSAARAGVSGLAIEDSPLPSIVAIAARDLELRDLVVARSVGPGIVITGAGSAELEDVLVRDSVGDGVQAVDSSTVAVRRSVAWENFGSGFVCSNRSVLDLTGVAVRGAAELRPNTPQANGLSIFGSSRTTVSGLSIDRVLDYHVSAATGSHLEAERLTMRDGLATALFVWSEASARVHDMVVERTLFGVTGQNTAQMIELSDVAMREMGARTMPSVSPLGMFFESTKYARVARFSYGSHGSPLIVTPPAGAVFEIDSLDSTSELMGDGGAAVALQEGALELTLTRASIRNAEENGITINPGNHVTLRDVKVEAAEVIGVFAHFNVDRPTCLEAERLAVVNAGSSGITADAGAQLRIHELAVTGLRNELGIAVKMRQSLGMVIDGFAFSGPGSIGLSIEADISIGVVHDCFGAVRPNVITNGRISNFRVGASITNPDVDIEDVTDHVAYEGNGESIRKGL